MKTHSFMFIKIIIILWISQQSVEIGARLTFVHLLLWDVLVLAATNSSPNGDFKLETSVDETGIRRHILI